MADLQKPPYQNKVCDRDGYMDKGWLAFFLAWAKEILSGFVQSVTGTAGRIQVTGTAINPIVNIDPAYVGQTSITTLGTVTTGTWHGTPIQEPYVVIPSRFGGWVSYTAPLASFVAASGGTDNAIVTLGTLPSGFAVHAVLVTATAGFAGGPVTQAQVMVGRTDATFITPGSPYGWTPLFDAGTAGAVQPTPILDYAVASTPLLAYLVVYDGLVSNLTTGSLAVSLFLSVVP